MVDLKQVTKTYPSADADGVTALREFSLSIPQGQFVVVTGRSGSGKTTLLHLVGGLIRPTAGSVMVHGIDLSIMTDRDQSALRGRTMGFVFQFPSLLPTLSALENVLLPTILSPNPRRDVATGKAIELLEMVGLADKLMALPAQLSAGQQQRVVVARSLINDPEILIADEPASNLDKRTEEEIMGVFQKTHALRRLTVIMAAHTPALAPGGARALELAEGRLVRDSGL